MCLGSRRACIHLRFVHSRFVQVFFYGLFLIRRVFSFKDEDDHLFSVDCLLASSSISSRSSFLKLSESHSAHDSRSESLTICDWNTVIGMLRLLGSDGCLSLS